MRWVRAYPCIATVLDRIGDDLASLLFPFSEQAQGRANDLAGVAVSAGIHEGLDERAQLTRE